MWEQKTLVVKFCVGVGVHYIIICAQSGEDRLGGSDVGRSLISSFPTDLCVDLYITATLYVASVIVDCYAPPHMAEALSDDARLTSV